MKIITTEQLGDLKEIHEKLLSSLEMLERLGDSEKSELGYGFDIGLAYSSIQHWAVQLFLTTCSIEENKYVVNNETKTKHAPSIDEIKILHKQVSNASSDGEVDDIFIKFIQGMP